MKFLKQSFSVFILKGLSRVIGLVVTIILARSLGASGFGQISLALAYFSILIIVAQAGLAQLAMRTVSKLQAGDLWKEVRQTVFNTYVLVGLAGGLVCFIVFVAIQVLESNNDSQYLHLLLLMLPLVLIRVYFQINQSVLLGLQHIVASHGSEMMERLIFLIVILVVGFVASDINTTNVIGTLYFSISVMLAVTCLALYLAFPASARRGSPNFSWPTFPKAAGAFLLIQFFGILNDNVDFLVLGFFVDAHELGIYRSVTRLMEVLQFGLVSVNGVVAPQIAALAAAGSTDKIQLLMKRAAWLVMGVFVIIAIPSALFLTSLLGLFGPEFVEGRQIWFILAIGKFASAACGTVGYLLTMMGKERLTIRLLGVSLAINIILNFVLVPVYGMAGAAVATAISLTCSNLLMLWFALIHTEIDPTVLGGRLVKIQSKILRRRRLEPAAGKESDEVRSDER